MNTVIIDKTIEAIVKLAFHLGSGEPDDGSVLDSAIALFEAARRGLGSAVIGTNWEGSAARRYADRREDEVSYLTAMADLDRSLRRLIDAQARAVWRARDHLMGMRFRLRVLRGLVEEMVARAGQQKADVFQIKVSAAMLTQMQDTLDSLTKTTQSHTAQLLALHTKLEQLSRGYSRLDEKPRLAVVPGNADEDIYMNMPLEELVKTLMTGVENRNRNPIEALDVDTAVNMNMIRNMVSDRVLDIITSRDEARKKNLDLDMGTADLFALYMPSLSALADDLDALNEIMEAGRGDIIKTMVKHKNANIDMNVITDMAMAIAGDIDISDIDIAAVVDMAGNTEKNMILTITMTMAITAAGVMGRDINMDVVNAMAAAMDVTMEDIDMVTVGAMAKAIAGNATGTGVIPDVVTAGAGSGVGGAGQLGASVVRR